MYEFSGRVARILGYISVKIRFVKHLKNIIYLILTEGVCIEKDKI